MKRHKIQSLKELYLSMDNLLSISVYKAYQVMKCRIEIFQQIMKQFMFTDEQTLSFLNIHNEDRWEFKTKTRLTE